MSQKEDPEHRRERLRRTPPECLPEIRGPQKPDIYLVVCENGFARGWLDDPLRYRTSLMLTMPDLQNCARLRNAMCSCRGKHRIVRAVQVGTGSDVE